MNMKHRKRILFVVVSFVGFFIILESAMQIWRFVQPDHFSINKIKIRGEGVPLPPHPKLLFGAGSFHVPHRLNSYGWRGAELADPKPAGSYRIMYLGDSSVWGWNVVEDTAFPYLAAELFSKNEGLMVEVANTGTPGYSSTQSRIVFEDNVDKVDPDALVIASIWSDIIVRPWTDADLMRRFSSEGYRFDSKIRLLIRKSALFSRMEVQIESLKGIPESRRIALGQTRGQVGASSLGNPRVPVEEHRKNLFGISKICRKKGIDIFLLILPIDGKVFNWPPDRLRAYRNNFRITAEKYDSVLVDTPSVFPTDPDSNANLFLDGIHPNAEGHALIAKALANALSNYYRQKTEKY